MHQTYIFAAVGWILGGMGDLKVVDLLARKFSPKLPNGTGIFSIFNQ